MVHFVRTTKVQMGRMLEAIAWGHRVIGYVNETYGTSFKLITNVTGSGNQLHFYGTYESLSGFEATSANLGEDQEYWAIVRESDGMLISFSDHLYRDL